VLHECAILQLYGIQARHTPLSAQRILQLATEEDMSSIPSGFWYTGEPFALDPNNSSYRIAKQNGTSMASPQVAGVLACALQLYPTMNQDMALKYITSYAGQNQLATAGGLVTDYAITNGLRTAPNRYLKFVNERKDTGAVFPKRSSWFRKTSGFVYPRTGNKSVRNSI
jgi:hypothetical protein